MIEKIEEDHDLVGLLDYLKQTRNFDFNNYKRASLERRLRRRMEVVGCTTYADYQDLLEVHPEEFSPLFDTIMINVTSFFRDPQSWAFVQEKIIPRILVEKKPDDPVRVWSAGCSTGQEPCTIAMILAEVLGPKAYQDRVKIYATDVDEKALTEARRGSFTEKDVQAVPEELRPKFFEPDNGRFLFVPEYRRAIIYGRHDLFLDAPISHLDLLVCRNTLMYFNSDVQTQILPRFHFALNENGFLFLGKAELIFKHAALFTPIDIRHHVFAKVPNISSRDHPIMISLTPENGGLAVNERRDRIRETAFEHGHIAQIVVDFNGILIAFNDRARNLFGLTSIDLKRSFQDLEISYRPLALRSLIDQAYSERRVVTQSNIVYHLPLGETRYLDVEVVPLQDTEKGLLGASISFIEMTQFHELKEDLQRYNHELEAAYEELQSSNEELETTNEELQSAVEELETTNEELQSSNEEMETMNEELQSSNEELQTVNDEMHVRSNDLTLDNAFLQSIVSSLQTGVVVLDQNLNVQTWNRNAENLWGLRLEEVIGNSFLTLDIGLPVENLAGPFRAILDGKSKFEELTLEAINRRGKALSCHLVINPLLNTDGKCKGIIVIMEAMDQ